MTHRKRGEAGHVVVPWQWLLPSVLIVVALGALGCQSREDIRGPEQTLVADAQASGATTPTSSSSLGPSPVSTPIPAVRVLPTPTTPDDTSTPLPPTRARPTPTSSLPSGPVVGAIAPSLALPDLTGGEVSLTGLQGKAVLLNFWTTW